MLDVAALLASQPLPAGRRVAIVTNVGGPAVMCADACEARGLEVPALAEATQVRLREFLPKEASVANPVDMLAAAAEQYRQTVEAVAEDPNIDAVIAIFLPPLATSPKDVARALSTATHDLKPLLEVFISAEGPPDSGGIPTYRTAEPAAIAPAHVADYAAWRARPIQTPATFQNVQPDQAGALLGEVVQRGGGWLAADEVRRLLSLYRYPWLSNGWSLHPMRRSPPLRSSAARWP
jgi:acyl-CoA synthetase (NDP forming)